MKSLAAVASTLLQLIYVLALINAVTSTIKFFQIKAFYGAGDPKLMAGAISTMVIDLLVGALIGLVGVLIAWYVLRNKEDCPSWFRRVSTFFAWMWIVFVPIGTVIGVLMLRWRKLEEKPA